MNRIDNYRDRASEIYRENRNIILLLAILTTVFNTFFDALDPQGFLGIAVIILQIIVTAPLLMCTYHVYTRVIQKKTTDSNFIFSWLTDGKFIIHGIKVQFLLMIKLIGWYILYFLIVIMSALLGSLGVIIGTVAGLVLICYKQLQYNGALYECAADPYYYVGAAFDDGIEKMKYCFKDYVSLWMSMCLPLIVVFGILNAIFEASSIAVVISFFSNIILNFFIYPRFHITGILLYNNGNFNHVKDVDNEDTLM
ncbi:MAG: hypothetical protein IKU13_02115 [Clostridia bacterium]|nr:hypothetical protein [Clostridia bacterium]MBR5265411.1 hypothetical protein [Clostridia bacterium]